MLKFLSVAIALVLFGSQALAEVYGLGRPALPEEIASWDKDVNPDGQGLPPGNGGVLTGEEIFADKCASCHGDFAEGVGNWPKLAGGAGTLADDDPLKTVGSYWPYLSTTWDYVNRSMPFGNAQSLESDEVYAIVAYILYSNDLVDEDFVLSHETFADVEMPNVNGFVPDDRFETEHSLWVGEPCMNNCKDVVEVTMRAMVLDVTPAESTLTVSEPEAEPAANPVAVDPELAARGEKVFKKCKACHQVGEGAKNRSGPHLNGIVERSAGGVEGFKYSAAFLQAADAGLVWTPKALTQFLAAPKKFIQGTKMGFSGLKSEEDQAAIVAYLSTLK